MKAKGIATLLGAAVCVAGLGAGPAVAKPPKPGPEVKQYKNNFEGNTKGWCDQAAFPCNGQENQSGTINLEPSGYSNYGLYAPFINSESGHRHARVSGAANTATGDCVGSGSGSNNPSPPCTGPYTEWGSDGSDSVFPERGFSTSLDIYLDTSWAQSHPDVRFDWDSALNDSNGNYMQDYVFNAGTDPNGQPDFVIGSSTNADRSGAYPENPCPSPSSPPNGCRTPVTISTSGWYRFTHRFSDDGTGHLAVEMTLTRDSDGTQVADWTIYPGQAISTVGGPALGWFPNEEIYGLPIDNASLELNKH